VKISNLSIMTLGAAGALALSAPAFAQTTTVLPGGWSVTTFDPNVTIAAVGFGDGVLFITKTATVVGTIEGGVPTPIVATFQQTSPNAVMNIAIVGETITNQSGVDWTAYRQTLLLSSRVGFNQAFSGGFNPAPFTTNTYSAPNAVGFTEVRHADGVVPNGSTWTPPGPNGGPLWISVQPGNLPVTFTLKEIPVPTPGSVALAGLAGLAAFRRRR
jgi:hypothetical protein